MPVCDPWPPSPPVPPDAYAILVRDFQAATWGTGGESRTVHMAVRLLADHPGPEFPDDIGAVASYEPIIATLRALCAEKTNDRAETLAGLAVAALAGLPHIRWVGVRVQLRTSRLDSSTCISHENVDVDVATCISPTVSKPKGIAKTDI